MTHNYQIYQRNPFFDTTELSTRHRGYQERRAVYVCSQRWPDGLPSGIQVQQRNALIAAAFKENGLAPPSDRQIQRWDKSGVLVASDMSDDCPPTRAEDR